MPIVKVIEIPTDHVLVRWKGRGGVVKFSIVEHYNIIDGSAFIERLKRMEIK